MLAKRELNAQVRLRAAVHFGQVVARHPSVALALLDAPPGARLPAPSRTLSMLSNIRQLLTFC